MTRRENRLKDWIESRYAIGSVDQCERHPVGFINHTYKVEADGGQYALTEFLHKSLHKIAMRADVVLKIKNLPVAYPIASTEGKHVEEFEGHPVWLCPWLEGASPQDREDGSGNMSCAQRKESVHYFKELHKQLEMISNENEDLDPEKFVASELPMGSEVRTAGIVQRLIDECRECYQGIVFPVAEMKLVHKDFERQNLLFGETEQLTGILDFDSLRAGNMFYEWAHITFNHVCDDANPSPTELQYYIENSPFDEIDNPRAQLLALMATFCEKDIQGFVWIAQRRHIELGRITDHYRRALTFAKNLLQ
ncbi:MAG: phosphotransferase [Candidatus Peribacteraceae bacterium]|nr:phosphotransferase [Candidatus Peribacteraceae bacterium]